ncbi:MAG: DUF4402 domain-containing protein [Halanaerobiales bacterium]|nr:DUF4402 domain-containing protein [Halanaerobiales bacterium]
MKKSLVLLCAMMVVLCASSVMAADIDFGIRAEILSQLVIIGGGLDGEGTILDFGRVYKGDAATMVDPANPATGTTAASFTLTGEGNLAYIVTLPPSATITNGEHVLNVYNFTTDLSGNIGNLVNGVGAFNVGATLEAIGMDISSGEYTGSATLTVAYHF